jgi:hypothetical protein
MFVHMAKRKLYIAVILLNAKVVFVNSETGSQYAFFATFTHDTYTLSPEINALAFSGKELIKL